MNVWNWTTFTSWNTEHPNIAVCCRCAIVCWTLGLVATSQWENLRSCLKNSPTCRIQILSSLPHLAMGRMGHCVFYSDQLGHRYEYVYLNYIRPTVGNIAVWSYNFSLHRNHCCALSCSRMQWSPENKLFNRPSKENVIHEMYKLS